jgi:Lon-like ATP-dependent protease
MTGEVSIQGTVKPVGGVVSKVEAARQAGVTKVFIPKENYQRIFADLDGIEVIPVDTVEEVIMGALVRPVMLTEPIPAPKPPEMLTVLQV